MALASTQTVYSGESVEFNRDIRPIFADNCYDCHGPDEQTRQGSTADGLRLDTKDGAFARLADGRFAVVRGEPDASELVRRVFSSDEGALMPPVEHRKKLTDRQKTLLRNWVAQGAVWSEHWAYEPPRRHDAPAVLHTRNVHNWIDQFILARLEREGIEPSVEADRRTLIRRVSFDLTGLPPEPANVEEFVANSNEEAWERLVDRMLNSPHFGERMAMYWLDLVRYADSVGYHGDQPVSVSPYRDYVIAAFNENMPFDRFTREQLAGDLLPKPTQAQLIASGYNRLGMMSAEGGVQDKEYLAKYAADRVRTASTVWMGSTLGCAECHDHKFDPFTTKDFYQFAAFFADIKERGLYAGAFADGNWGPKVEITDEELPALLKPLDTELAILQRMTETHTEELAVAQREWERQILADRTPWQPLHPIEAVALNGSELTVLEDDSVLASGPVGETNTYTVHVETPFTGITGFRVEVLPHESLPRHGPGRANGNFVLTELTVEAGVDDSHASPQQVALQRAIADFEQTIAAEMNPYKVWGAAAVIDRDVKGADWGWAIASQEGRSHQLIVETSRPLQHTGNTASERLTFRLDQNLRILPNFNIGRFRLWATAAVRPLSVDPILMLPDDIREIVTIDEFSRSVEQREKLAAYYRGITPLLAPVRKQFAELTQQRQKVVAQHTRSSLITVAVEQRQMRVLPRGNWMDDSGEVVQPGVPAFLKQIDVAERATRLDLANWLVSDANPLAARVFVNRLWKLFYGSGLSKVLDDVGSRGEPPVHPELLDMLAVEFVESGWDVKRIVKQMVMSGTYRQSSLMREKLREIDPYNRLLARQSRWRLDAECIRDNALAISGLLVKTIGGRSVKPYQPDGLYRHLNFPPRTYEHDTDQNQYRRGLYTHWQRQFLHPALQCFDAPSREESTAERGRSNTPLAALNLLNDPSYFEAARVLAARALHEEGQSDLQRIGWIIQQALSRDLKEAERAVLQSLLDSQRERFADDPQAGQQVISTGLSPTPKHINAVELAAWTAVTRVVLNMHELITRN